MRSHPTNPLRRFSENAKRDVMRVFDMRHAVIEQVKEVLKIEAEAILNLMERVGPEFDRAIQMILKAKGRVILTGMGKSGLVARKISATLNSTGTPSLFLHPAEAVHGDLGMVTSDDIVIAISHSGKTGEINSLLPIIKNMGAKIIAFTGCMDSAHGRGKRPGHRRGRRAGSMPHGFGPDREHHSGACHGRCSCGRAHQCQAL